MDNTADKQARLNEAMSRAKKLIQLESNGTLDKIAAAHKDGINTSLGDENVMTKDLMTTARKRNAQAPTQTMRMSEAANKVPAAIREAFMKKPISDADLYKAFGDQGDGRSLSFLMEGMETQQNEVVPPQNIREIVNEGTYTQPQQMSQSVDYPMIRTIVEDVVRKYASSLNKKIISEGKENPNVLNTFSIGKTFKFLDSKGNIYEATLRKISNINEIKDKKGTKI